MGKLRQTLSTLLVIGILTASAFAQTSLTQIRDTINNPNGTPFNGTLTITWVGLSSPASGSLSPASTSARIYNGTLSVLLAPSTTAAAGSYYQVVYNSNDATVTWAETWSVPASSTALTVSSVRTASTSGAGSTGTGGTTTGGGTTQYATLPIALTQVTGLSASLSALNTSLATLQTTVSGLSTTGLTSLTNTVNGLSTSVSANTTNITALTATVGGLSTSSASNSSTVSGLSTTVASLSAAVTALQASGIIRTIAVTFIDGEVPAGVTNGSNASFTISQGPTPAASLELYRNGLVQTSGVDYIISGTTVTFLLGDIPAAGDVLQAYYRTLGSSPLPTFVDNEVPSGLLNGSNLTFSLAAAPTSQTGLKLYKNGLLMQLHSDYTLSGAIVTFASASMPQPGDAIVAYYR